MGTIRAHDLQTCLPAKLPWTAHAMMQTRVTKVSIVGVTKTKLPDFGGSSALGRSAVMERLR